jgi:hypothetical protein
VKIIAKMWLKGEHLGVRVPLHPLWRKGKVISREGGGGRRVKEQDVVQVKGGKCGGEVE